MLDFPLRGVSCSDFMCKSHWHSAESGDSVCFLGNRWTRPLNSSDLCGGSASIYPQQRSSTEAMHGDKRADRKKQTGCVDHLCNICVPSAALSAEDTRTWAPPQPPPPPRLLPRPLATAASSPAWGPLPPELASPVSPAGKRLPPVVSWSL